jgi:MFS family permease
VEFLRSLRQLWRHRYFRRLLAVRVATQSTDGVLQIALASYVLFSPERQPDAASIAAVLAITLLPFSILGPFVGIVLDRAARRQVLVVVDLCRAGLAVGLAVLVATGLRTGAVETVFYGGVLLAMSLNRFLLAALSASLPHTIEPDEYMVANSVVPTVGPAGVLIGAGVGTVLRLILGRVMPDYSANAILFGVAAAGYLFSASLALRIPRRRLGPDDVEPTRPRVVVAGLIEALAHLRERRPAGLGLLTIGAHRVIYGIVTVATILVYRNYFHTLEQVEAAIADLGVLVVVTGAGFVFAAVVTPPASAWLGIRRWMAICLVGSAAFQVFPGAVYAKVPLGIAAFLLGLTAQNIKICVDTLVQAHVADEVKGRVFVLYDMVFNVALVLAAVIGTLILPVNGKSVPMLLVLAGCYLAVAGWFVLASRGLSMNRGTESLTHLAARASRLKTAEEGESRPGDTRLPS